MSMQLLVVTPRDYFSECFNLTERQTLEAFRAFYAVVSQANLESGIDFSASRRVEAIDFLSSEFECHFEAMQNASPIEKKAAASDVFLPVYVDGGLSLPFRYQYGNGEVIEFCISDMLPLELSLKRLEAFLLSENLETQKQMSIYLEDHRRAMQLAKENRCILAYSY